MTTTTLSTPARHQPAPAEALDSAAAAVAAAESAAVTLLVAAADWADAHVVTDPLNAAGWEDRSLYSEGISLLAGPGSPMIAEFAPLEFAGRLGWSLGAAKSLIAEAIELEHRLPRLWGLVLEQLVPARVARYIASCTTDLSFEAAKQADRIVCSDPTRISKVRAEALVDEMRLWFEPDRAIADEENARDRRGVFNRPGNHPAVTEINLILDTPDALRFENGVADIARSLKHLGDTDALDIRRAKAVGVLANPQQALNLLSDAAITPRPSMPTTVFVHIDQAALANTVGGVGACSIERLGAVSSDLIREWLTVSNVVIRPVLDMNRDDTVEAHDPPTWMRELVIQRDAHCVFPGCRRDSRACDLDHIEPYDAGGPTNPSNLAPLCRTHHRAKTHANYDYRRAPEGAYHWTLPSGDQITVIPTSRKPITPR